MTTRLLNTFNVTLFFVGILTIAVVVNVFAQRPEMRSRIDATKTRAYSLSEQTMRMLSGIEGDWTIALVMIQAETDRSVRRQIDEVLHRFTQASPRISVKRIDPTDPRTLGDYESLLADLRERYGDEVAAHDDHLDAGRAAFEELILFAQQQSGMLEQHLQVAQASGESGASFDRLVRRVQTLALLADQGADVLAEVDKARRVSDTQPIPDYDVARSILVQALATAANELYDLAEQFAEFVRDRELSTELRAHLSTVRGEYDQWARQLAVIVDPLQHLPPLELATIGRHVATGEAAVVLGPGRAAVIPSSQLFPRSNIRRVGEGVAFDQRFRGEQLIAAAMRSLLVEHMPMVVFMHAEDGSWLRQRDRQVDLRGIATVLKSSRFDIEEWIVGSGEKPSPQPGQPVVWVPIAPPQRAGLEPSRRELELISSVQRLIADGEPVLLSVYPSMLPRYGQADPWARLAEPFGLRSATSRVIYESFRTAQDQTEVQRSQLVQRFDAGHATGRALQGQQTHFALPTPIEILDDAPGSVQHQVIASISPSPNRWLESDWAADPKSLSQPQPEQRFTDPVPIVMAAERPNPVTRGRQRLMLVGSGGWMLTYISDAVVGVGGDRVALVNPGNHELMLASVAWLAGMDELIAQTPTGQEIARLENITDASRRRWIWLTVAILPAMCLALGLLVWGIRRT